MSPRLRRLLLVLALGALTVASYEPAYHADFIHFDDTGYIQTNPHVQNGLQLAEVRWALTGYHLSNWHPLTWISHMVDVEVFHFDPRGHHAENIAFHVLNVVLLFALLRATTEQTGPSFFAAALFALHPVNVESVAWIAQRKTLLCTLFALLSIASYVRYARGGGARPYAASLFWLVLSLLSKGMFVTMPFALLLLDYWPLQRAAFGDPHEGRTPVSALLRGWLRLLPEKIPYAILGALVSIITLDAQRDSMSTIESYPVALRLANVALSYVKYLGLFFAPLKLSVFYPLYPEELTPRLVLPCVALLAATTVAAFWIGRRRRYLLVGWLWYLGMLVPVIGLVQVGMQSMADRYAYVPFWGLAIALAWAARDLLTALLPRSALRPIAAAATAVVLGGAALLTWRQAGRWHDGIRLFESGLANTDHNWLAHGVLAERYYALRDFPKTIEHCKEAVKFDRDLGTVRSTYGLALYETGQPEQAREQFELAVQQEPNNPVGYMNLGWIYVERGEYERAIQQLSAGAQQITKTTPAYTKEMIYANWASALAKSGQLPAARQMYGRALEIDRDAPAVLRDAARTDLLMGDGAGAEARLRRALAKEPTDPDARYLLACAVLLRDRPDEATPLFEDALHGDPRKAIVAVDLARTIGQSGRPEDGLRILDALLALPPATDAAAAQFVTSTVLTYRAEIVVAGDPPAAVRDLDRALAIWPDNYDANNRLAFLLATSADLRLRDPARAVGLAERATAARREYGSLATLAAAYAVSGRLADAVATATEAQDLAAKAQNPEAVAALEQQRQLYTRARDEVTAPKR